MDQAQKYKALFNATIKTWRVEGKRFNLDDALYEAELAEIAKEKHARNGSNGSNGSEPERVKCWCAEGIVNGKRVVVHRPADCEYTARRSALVFEAVRIANQRVGDPMGCPAAGYGWTKEFNKIMHRLCCDAGLLR